MVGGKLLEDLSQVRYSGHRGSRNNSGGGWFSNDGGSQNSAGVDSSRHTHEFTTTNIGKMSSKSTIVADIAFVVPICLQVIPGSASIAFSSHESSVVLCRSSSSGCVNVHRIWISGWNEWSGCGIEGVEIGVPSNRGVPSERRFLLYSFNLPVVHSNGFLDETFQFVCVSLGVHKSVLNAIG